MSGRAKGCWAGLAVILAILALGWWAFDGNTNTLRARLTLVVETPEGEPAPRRAQCRGRCAGSVCCQMPTSAIQRITAPGTISLASCAIRLGGRCWLRRHREHSGGYLGRFPDISGLECTEFSSVTRPSMRYVSDFGPKA
jgi:hypothetical protein